VTAPIGTFCLVLHTHLPWLAHHGRWPVGEEWLHQAWSQSYLPLTAMLTGLAERGQRDVLTIGVTPVLAAQLDDPYCVSEQHRWLADWALRADDLSGHRDPVMRSLGTQESRRARQATRVFERDWLHGGAPVWRSLVDAETIELLGGPATHPVLPLLRDPVADLALAAGLDDGVRRWGRRPAGIWLPECAYRPGLEQLLARHGVQRLMLDGPSLQHVGATTGRPWLLGDSDIAVVGRDLDVTYRVWSPRRGYPGGRWYRDFHSYHHASGFKLFRVTGSHLPPEQKAPYDQERAIRAVREDVEDFVGVVTRRLGDIAAEQGRPGLVVAAYDTELFGHWWHEGVQWLAGVLQRLREVGVRLTTLSRAVERVEIAGVMHPERSSWGLGKDLAIWEGPAVKDMLDDQLWAQDTLLGAVRSREPRPLGHEAWLDELAEQVLLACASDWPFMVSHDSSADYARERLAGHIRAVGHLAASGQRTAGQRTAGQRTAGSPSASPFGGVDARLLATPSSPTGPSGCRGDAQDRVPPGSVR
jgi:1,4-alpha-glucan branching enzyme